MALALFNDAEEAHRSPPTSESAPSAHLMSCASDDRVVSHPGQHKRATFPTSKAPISAIFHSFRLIFGRAIISRNGLEAWMCFP